MAALIMVLVDCITIGWRSVSMRAGLFADDAGQSGTFCGVPDDLSHIYHIQPVEQNGDFLDLQAVVVIIGQRLHRHPR
jgi:hypothetical protein